MGDKDMGSSQVGIMYKFTTHFWINVVLYQTVSFTNILAYCPILLCDDESGDNC